MREVRQAAARPSSQTRYWGLITRLVTVNSSTAHSAASSGTATVQRRARTRQSTSQHRASPVRARLAVASADTYRPVNSMAPYR
ncbi:hypothetical protein [Streptomyces xanthochromogenes]|uniref:hypothetical protein n=1 Tax=Streptomyces xanthochromogenes TaxID=67384 RepID=UPI002F400472